MNFFKLKFNNSLQKNLLIAAFVSLFNSCGQGAKYKAKDVTFNSEATMISTTNISQAERNIATRICYSYESKAKKFTSSEYLGGSFKFKNSKYDCADQSMNYDVTSVLQVEGADRPKFNPLNLESNQSFFGAIQTDRFGYLSVVCLKIKNNEPISNTTTISGQTVQIAFSRTNLDTYTLNYFSLSGGSSKIVMSETFKTRTQFDYVSGQILGMDEYYQKNTICSDGKKSSQFNQVYSGRN